MKLTAEEKQKVVSKHFSAKIQGNDVYISYSDGKTNHCTIGHGYIKTN